MAPHQLDGNATLREYEPKPLASTANQKSETAGKIMCLVDVVVMLVCDCCI